MIRALREKFLDPAVDGVPRARRPRRMGRRSFSSILEILGEDEGIEQFEQLLEGKEDVTDDPMLNGAFEIPEPRQDARIPAAAPVLRGQALSGAGKTWVKSPRIRPVLAPCVSSTIPTG